MVQDRPKHSRVREFNLKSFSHLFQLHFVAGGKVGAFDWLGRAVGFERQANVQGAVATTLSARHCIALVHKQ